MGRNRLRGYFIPKNPLGCDELTTSLVSTERGNNFPLRAVCTNETRPICGAGSLDSLTRAALQKRGNG
jgi:hypothetical protein